MQTPPIALRIEASSLGTSVLDLRSGLRFVVPDVVGIFPAQTTLPTCDVMLFCFHHPIEVRLRIDSVPMAPSPHVAAMLCRTYALNRTNAQVQVGIAQPSQTHDWNVIAAASAIYPLRQLEEGKDYEECVYLLKDNSAAVLTKRFASQQLTSQRWAEFNGRFNASLSWGAERTIAAPVTSFFVDAQMNLTSNAASFAQQLATELSNARVPKSEVASTASGLRTVAYGSDAPDAPIDPQLPELLWMTAFGNVLSAPFRLQLEKLLQEKVRTYRDLRGLHLFLEQLTRSMH